MEQLLALGLCEVQSHASFVPAHALPHETDAVLLVPPGSHRISDPWLLDLDDLGPELAQCGPDHRARGERRRLDDTDAAQGASSVIH